MWNIRKKTLADFMESHVKDPDLQNILSALWGYHGLPPSRLSGFYYANATGEYLRSGSCYIRERSQDLSNALADMILKQAYEWLMACAEKITTPEYRKSYLENVWENREILEEARVRGLATEWSSAII